MIEQSKYDPEDIESLLINKEFGELYDEEREFVLRHISSKEEYARMRQVLLMVAKDEREELHPPGDLKAELLKAFDRRHARPGWLNFLYSLIVPAEGRRDLFPAARLAFVSVLVLLSAASLWYFFRGGNAGNAGSRMVSERKMPGLSLPVKTNQNPERHVPEPRKETPSRQLVKKEPLPETPKPELAATKLSVKVSEDEPLLDLLYTAL